MTTETIGLPLFFKEPRAVDSTKHAKASVSPVADFSFTKTTNSVTLNAIEFIEAVKTFPIVFTTDEDPRPIAILGLEKQNYFVKNGEWKEGAYIPAYIRQYPFVFFEHKEEQKFYLCIDEASSFFAPKVRKGCLPLFNEDGSQSDLVKNALQFCTSYYQHHQITKHFCDDLKAHKLLIPYQSEIHLNNGKKLALGGFQMIDEKQFNALSDDVILDFRKKGWLAFIYLALASSSNWKNLVEIANKEGKKAA